MRQLDLEILKADIDWLRAYADLAVKHPSVSERALLPWRENFFIVSVSVHYKVGLTGFFEIKRTGWELA